MEHYDSNMLPLAWVIFGLLIAIGILLFVNFLGESYDSRSTQQLDYDMCEQLRQNGWEEQDIKNLMHASGGYYDKE